MVVPSTGTEAVPIKIYGFLLIWPNIGSCSINKAAPLFAIDAAGPAGGAVAEALRPSGGGRAFLPDGPFGAFGGGAGASVAGVAAPDGAGPDGGGGMLLVFSRSMLS